MWLSEDDSEPTPDVEQDESTYGSVEKPPSIRLEQSNIQATRQLWQTCCNEDQMAMSGVLAENMTLRGGDDDEAEDFGSMRYPSLRKGVQRVVPLSRVASEDEEIDGGQFDGVVSDSDSESDPSCDDDLVDLEAHSLGKEGPEPTELQEPQTRSEMLEKPFEDNDNLADAVARLSWFLCTEEYASGLPASIAIVFFSGVLGFSPGGSTFETPRNYTPKLSAVIYCIRLCMIERHLPRFAHTSNGWTARPRVGGLRQFVKVRDRFLCHGCQSPSGELLGLRSYGRALARSDGPSFRVNWSNDSQTVRWDEGSITMDQLRALGHRALESAKQSMRRLLCGISPALRLDTLRDEMSNQHYGYSIVQDPVNNLDKAYLQLSSRACLDPADGLMSSENWRIDAVRRYLKEETNLLINIMLIMYLHGGQAPRTAEFLSIECHNGPSNARGVYVQDGSVLYITRHSKARRMTNQEFQVARYLPPDDSKLLVTYLAYVRPFGDMLYRVCCGYKRERRLLFTSIENVDRHWKSDVLTSALKKISKDVFGISFGVQVYRQLSIAVTERHVKQISRPFNIFDDKSIAADVDVVFAWQSGHRPLQRGTSYGIDEAYPDSLQPALLRVYQWASQQWHSFLFCQSGVLSTEAQTMNRISVDDASQVHQAISGSKHRLSDLPLGCDESMRFTPPMDGEHYAQSDEQSLCDEMNQTSRKRRKMYRRTQTFPAPTPDRARHDAGHNSAEARESMYYRQTFDVQKIKKIKKIRVLAGVMFFVVPL